MKQGRAVTLHGSGAKTEPVEQKINPGAVSRIGIEQSPFTTSKSLYEGRGLSAPMAGQTNHKAGSQGKR